MDKLAGLAGGHDRLIPKQGDLHAPPAQSRTIQFLYQPFTASDRTRILELFHPEIEWIQNEGFPNGGRHVGATTVLDEVFARFRIEWESWQAVVDRWLDAREAIVALGEYRGIHKATGRAMRAALAHVYWVRDGRIVRFEQYADTLRVAEATWLAEARLVSTLFDEEE